MISLESVVKRFGLKQAVRGISFETKKGEIIGFLGPNGAGKTTTMRLIMGLLQPTEGTVIVDGKNPIIHRLQTLPHIGYLPENNPLYAEMRVSEYLEFISDIKEDKAEHVYEIIDKVHIEDVIETKIEELSRGYRQRVGLAAALLGNPDILILDEPTSGLDPIEQDKIKELIREIAKERTVIFSTHILSEVEDIANRIIIVKEGRKVYDGSKPKGKGEVEKLFKNLMRADSPSISEVEEKPKVQKTEKKETAKKKTATKIVKKKETKSKKK